MNDYAKESPVIPPPRFGLKGMMHLLTIAILAGSHFWTSLRLNEAQTELRVLRRETGQISADDDSKVIGIRVPSAEPLTWKLRVRIPSKGDYQLAVSTFWPAEKAGPDWYEAQPLPDGESLITVRLMTDPRDNRWKIITLLVHEGNVFRVARNLTERQIALFRGSNDTIRGGIREQTEVTVGNRLRLIDEKWFTGEGGLMLFGDSAPSDDMDGVFVEIQPAPRLLNNQTSS